VNVQPNFTVGMRGLYSSSLAKIVLRFPIIIAQPKTVGAPGCRVSYCHGSTGAFHVFRVCFQIQLNRKQQANAVVEEATVLSSLWRKSRDRLDVRVQGFPPVCEYCELMFGSVHPCCIVYLSMLENLRLSFSTRPQCWYGGVNVP
jgi:hypothetical protein